MKKVSIFGVGNIGARVAYFLARNREIARIRLVDNDAGRSRATWLDFTQSSVALQSKIAFADYEEPKEIEHSDVVIVAAGLSGRVEAEPEIPSDRDVATIEEIAAHIGHIAPQAIVAVVSQPAELFCAVVARGGRIDPARVIGFPSLNSREWFRERIARVVGVGNEDIRITTVRTLQGQELVVDQCAVGGVPLRALVENLETVAKRPTAEELHDRLRSYHYAPAAIIAEVAGELVSKRRQVITMICRDPELDAFVESKAIIGPHGVERLLEFDLDARQRELHREYRERVADLTFRIGG